MFTANYNLDLAGNETLEFILVRQKNMILELIMDSVESLEEGNWNNGIEGLQAALAMLRNNRELWEATGYGYKLNELVRRIDDAQWTAASQLPKQAKRKAEDCGRLYNICKNLYIS